jgi:hypothetical protein
MCVSGVFSAQFHFRNVSKNWLQEVGRGGLQPYAAYAALNGNSITLAQ